MADLACTNRGRDFGTNFGLIKCPLATCHWHGRAGRWGHTLRHVCGAYVATLWNKSARVQLPATLGTSSQAILSPL